MVKIQLFGEEKPTELKHICLTDSRYPIRHYVAAAGERLNCQSDEPLNKMQVRARKRGISIIIISNQIFKTGKKIFNVFSEHKIPHPTVIF